MHIIIVMLKLGLRQYKIGIKHRCLDGPLLPPGKQFIISLALNKVELYNRVPVFTYKYINLFFWE